MKEVFPVTNRAKQTYRTRSRSKAISYLEPVNDLEVENKTHCEGRKVNKNSAASAKVFPDLSKGATSSCKNTHKKKAMHRKAKEKSPKEAEKTKRERTQKKGGNNMLTSRAGKQKSRKDNTKIIPSKVVKRKPKATVSTKSAIKKPVPKKVYLPKKHQQQCVSCNHNIKSHSLYRRHLHSCDLLAYLKLIKYQYLVKVARQPSWINSCSPVLEEEKTVYKCNLCAKKLNLGSMMSYHFLKKHSRKLTQNRHWLKFVRDKLRLRKSSGKLATDYINKKLKVSREVTSSMSNGERWTPFECLYCSKSFEKKTSLNRHMDKHHPPKNRVAPQQPLPGVVPESLFQCCICRTCCKSLKLLTGHLKVCVCVFYL